MEQVTMFKCGETGKLFDTEAKAKNSERRVKNKRKKDEEKKIKLEEERKILEFQRNYVRLNARYPRDIFRLVKEKALEFWGLQLNYDPDKIVPRMNSRNGALTMRVNMEFKASILDKEKSKVVLSGDSFFGDSISSVFKHKGFSGFETGSGCPGSFDDYRFRMDVTVKVLEFPLLMENYSKYLAQKEIQNKEFRERARAAEYASRVSKNTPEHLDIESKICMLENLTSEFMGLKRKIYTSHVEEFLTKWDKCNPKQHDNSLFSEFD